MPFFVGIDGGGSKTDCLVGDESSVLGWASAGSSKIARVGEEAAAAALGDAIRRACAAAGVKASDVSCTCMGVAGASESESVTVIRRLLGGIVSGGIEIMGDMEVALHAAFDGSDGVVVVSGTGSIAYGRNPEGETARAGGFGPPPSDVGSGEWIGRNAVEFLLVANENGHSPALLQSVLRIWKLETFQQLAQALRASPPPDFAALFPTLAVSNDAIARRVLARAGRELAGLVADVIGRLWPEPKPVKVAMYGGVLDNSPEVRDALIAGLSDRYPEASVAPGKRRPAEGALLLARKNAVAASSGAA